MTFILILVSKHAAKELLSRVKGLFRAVQSLFAPKHAAQGLLGLVKGLFGAVQSLLGPVYDLLLFIPIPKRAAQGLLGLVKGLFRGIQNCRPSAIMGHVRGVENPRV